jgi:hypothetical protein
LATTAIATESVIGSVRGDHKPAANQCDENLSPMGRQMISPKGAAKDEG